MSTVRDRLLDAHAARVTAVRCELRDLEKHIEHCYAERRRLQQRLQHALAEESAVLHSLNS